MTAEQRKRRWVLYLAGPTALLPLYWIVPHISLTFGQALALVTTTTAAWTDLKSSKIFNWCTYPALFWGVLISVLGKLNAQAGTALGAQSPSACFLGFSACLVGMLVLHDLTGGGMGDVKLAAALGSLIGLGTAVWVIPMSYALAGAHAFAGAVGRHGTVTTVSGFLKSFGRCVLPEGLRPAYRPAEQAMLQERVRLGPYFLAGTALTFLARLG